MCRHLGGWYTGVPSGLKPAPRRAQAEAIVALAGGMSKLLERAAASLESGDLKIASRLADWAADAEPESREVHALRARVYQKQAAVADSTMARGVYTGAARESKALSS